MNIANNPKQLMKPEEAEEAAKELNTEDDGWTYKAKHDPTGRGLSYIEVYDEDGELIGKL